MSTDIYIFCEECGEELELVDIKRYKYRDSFAYKVKPCQDCIQKSINKAIKEAQALHKTWDVNVIQTENINERFIKLHCIGCPYASQERITEGLPGCSSEKPEDV